MTEVIQGITYAREILSPDFARELMPLLEAHHSEVDFHQEEGLDPDWESYFALQVIDQLRIFTARDEQGKLIGYMVLFVRNDLHHRGSKRATADLFYISRERRGFGLEFLLWCCSELKAEGVKIAFEHISEKFDWGSMARRAGFEKVETIWAKVL